MDEQLGQLNLLARETLEFARDALPETPVNLVALTDAALRLHVRAITSKKIHLVRSLPSELLAHVHRGQILRVLTNLITNAVYALPDGGILSIRLRKRESEFDILVGDNGSGIDAAHLGLIFEPFYTTSATGNGLGLALSKRIVEAHRGRISVRTSVASHRRGTVFKVSLPLVG